MSKVEVNSGRSNWPMFVYRVDLPGHGVRIRLELSRRTRIDFIPSTIPAICDALIDCAETDDAPQ